MATKVKESKPRKICYHCPGCDNGFEAIQAKAVECPSCGFQILDDYNDSPMGKIHPSSQIELVSFGATPPIPESASVSPSPEQEKPAEPYFKIGQRYYSQSGTSGIYGSDSRCMKCIKIEEGADFGGNKSFRYIYTPSEMEWSPTPCCVVDRGKIRALAYEIDRTLLAGLGMPAGRSYDSLNLQSREELSFAVGLDDDSVAGLKDIRLKLRALVEQLA